MRAYTEPILTATWIFPFVAAFITLPYMVFQYRRYGSIPLLRTVILYSFVLYMMCAYFLTMLPLPDRDVVANLTTPYLQLEPFKGVAVWLENSNFVLNDISTWKSLLNRDLFVIVANIAMTIPLGIYLRYYFGCTWKQTFLISLGVSLVFELTQLSALFGIYPRPYRLCETDDLITNTLGGMIGYWIAKPIMKILPTREKMDAIAYRRGTHVSVTRRITAALVDWFLLGCFTLFVLLPNPLIRAWLRINTVPVWLVVFATIYIMLVLMYFVVGEWLMKGLTIGKRLTHLRLVDERDGSRPKLWQCLVRYSLLYYAFMPLPFISLGLYVYALRNSEVDMTAMIACLVIIVVYAIMLVLIVVGVLSRRNQLPHGALSKTRNISTLVLPPEDQTTVGEPRNVPIQDTLPPDTPGPLLNGQ